MLGGTAWDRFSEDVELAKIGLCPAQAVVVGSQVHCCLGSRWLPSQVLGDDHLRTAGAVIGRRVPIAVRADRQRFAFATQLPDNLQVLASALRAGHSLVGALAIMTEDAAEPSSARSSVAWSARSAWACRSTSRWQRSVRRMRSREVMQIALVTIVQQQTGGNTAEILDQVATNVRGRFELRRLVRTLTAQGRVSRWVVTALPIVLFLLIYLINPAMRARFSTPRSARC